VPNPIGNTAASGTNNSGQIVGYDSSGYACRGYFHDNGAFKEIDDPLAATGTYPMGINNFG
jgi:hypothetical protein